MFQVQVRYPEPNQTRRQGWHDVQHVPFTAKGDAEAWAHELKAFMGKEADYRVVSRTQSC